MTAETMREIERLVVEEAGILPVQTLENAGRALAEVTRQTVGSTVAERRVGVLVGAGPNGAGGLVAARRLTCWGATVVVWLSGPAEDDTAAAGAPLDTARAVGVHVRSGPPGEADLQGMHAVVDAVVGCEGSGAPVGVTASLVCAALRAAGDGLPVVALDVPSGLDPDTGQAPGLVVRATHTVTLALPKTGLLSADAAGYVGALTVADVGVPAWAYAAVGVDPGALFRTSDLVRLW